MTAPEKRKEGKKDRKKLIFKFSVFSWSFYEMFAIKTPENSKRCDAAVIMKLRDKHGAENSGM